MVFIKSCNVLGSIAKRFTLETAENTTREKISPLYLHLEMNHVRLFWKNYFDFNIDIIIIYYMYRLSAIKIIQDLARIQKRIQL